MRLRTDERGVTVQVGTVLLFAVLIILLSTYQATVVPQQNERVEFNHNQQVQGQLQDLRDELLRTAATGSGGSASVALGTQYPVRAMFVNPAPPSGTLRTTPPANVTLLNATATGETGDYWDGSDRNFSTRGLVYDPIYHVYQNPPTTVYDNGVLYNRFDGANLTLAGQRLVRGNRISLVAVNGSLSKSTSGSATVDLQPVSPATRTVTVRNESEDENVTIVVPTNRDVDEWEELLEDELDEDENDPDKHVKEVADATTTDGKNAVELVLEPGVYELELAKVGVSPDASEVGPHYVTDVRGDDASVSENSQQELVVEVRDRFNNPVSSAQVNASTAFSNSSVAPTTAMTDDEGRVEFTYTAPTNLTGVATISDKVNVSYEVDLATVTSFDASARQNLTTSVTVRNADRSGLGDGGTDINPVRDGAVIVENERNGGGHSISFEFNNTGKERNVTDARINFYYSSQTGGGRVPDSANVLGPDGQVRTTVQVGGPYESLDQNGGAIKLANESVTTATLDFSGGKMGNRDYVVVTVIYDDGESAATYFIAP